MRDILYGSGVREAEVHFAKDREWLESCLETLNYKDEMAEQEALRRGER